MNIIVPATHEPAWPGGTVFQIDPTDDTAYWQFWADLWAAQETTTIVEHDITPTDEALADLDACPNGWCTQPYQYQRVRYMHGLGCVKFTGELMARTPDLWDEIAVMGNRLHPPKHWCRLDAWARQALTRAGEKRCHHTIRVEHPRRSHSSHGCC